MKVLQVKNLVLYFFLLILKIIFNFSLDTGYKCGRFFKTLLEKSFKFVLNWRDCIVMFISSFILLLTKVNLILERLYCKIDAFMAHCTSRIEIILVLLIAIVAFYIRALII